MKFPIRYERLSRTENGVESTYLQRLSIGRLNLHLFHRGDGDEAPHDHPWGFATFPLADYLDETYYPDTGKTHLRVVEKFRWHHRDATYAHRVVMRVTPGRWLGEKFVTIVWKTRKRREWGGWTKEGWVHWRSHFAGRVLQLRATR